MPIIIVCENHLLTPGPSLVDSLVPKLKNFFMESSYGEFPENKHLKVKTLVDNNLAVTTELHNNAPDLFSPEALYFHDQLMQRNSLILNSLQTCMQREAEFIPIDISASESDRIHDLFTQTKLDPNDEEHINNILASTPLRDEFMALNLACNVLSGKQDGVAFIGLLHAKGMQKKLQSIFGEQCEHLFQFVFPFNEDVHVISELEDSHGEKIIQSILDKQYKSSLPIHPFDLTKHQPEQYFNRLLDILPVSKQDFGNNKVIHAASDKIALESVKRLEVLMVLDEQVRLFKASPKDFFSAPKFTTQQLEDILAKQPIIRSESNMLDYCFHAWKITQKNIKRADALEQKMPEDNEEDLISEYESELEDDSDYEDELKVADQDSLKGFRRN